MDDVSKRSAPSDTDTAEDKGVATAPESRAGRITVLVERFSLRFAQFIVDNRVWVILASLVVVGLCLFTLQGAESSADTRIFFGKDNPQLKTLQELDNTYTKKNSVLFAITDKSHDLFNAADLKAIAEMTDEAWRGPYVLRVDSIANFQQLKSTQDSISVEPLYTPDEALTPQRLAEIKKTTLSQSQLVNSLISPSGTVTGINMLVVLPDHANQDKAAVKVADFALQLAAKWRARWPSLEVHLTGGVMADYTFAEAGHRDLHRLIPIMALILFGALTIGLKSIRATIVILTVIGCTVVAGLAAAVLLGSTINVATASAPIAVMVLTVSSAVHLLLGWVRAASRGQSSKDAIRESVQVNFAPIAATSLTTVIGFLSLNFSDSPPLRELGNIVALGTLASWIFSLTLLPALVTFLPPVKPIMLNAANAAARRIGDFVASHSVALVVGFTIVTGVLAYGATQLVLDDNYIRYFGPSFEFRRDTDYIEKHLTGLNAIEYSLDSGTAGGVFDPNFLKKVDRFSAWLKAQPNVVFVNSLPTLIKRLNQAMEGGGADAYRLGATRKANAQNFLLYEISLPSGQELTDTIDINRAKTLVTAVVRGGSSAEIRQLASAGENWLKTNTPDMYAPASGLSVAFAYLSERNLKSMLVGTTFGLMLVSVILLFVFQDVRIGLLSLVPNLVPALQAFGVWGHFVGNVNLAATVVTSMTFGIIVDDTIHITMKYLRSRRVAGESPRAAVRSTLATVGFPAFLTSVAIISGFGVIATSDFQLSQYLGGLTVLIVAFALISDIFLLLPLILLIERTKR